MTVPTGTGATSTLPWLLVEDEFDPATQHAVETRFTIGNGRFSTRGSLEEGYPGDRPATLMHGIFAPHPIVFTELANLPDWTALEVVVDGERFAMDRGTVISCRRALDLRSGKLSRDVRWRGPAGGTVDVRFERFASLAEPDVAAVRVTIAPTDAPTQVEVRASLPATATNNGLSHIAWDDQHTDSSTASLAVHVIDTDLSLAYAARLRVIGGAAESHGWDVRGHPTLVASLHLQPGEAARFEKVVVLRSSRDGSDPRSAAVERLSALEATDFDELHAASAAAWSRDWAISDVVIEGDPEAQLAIRFSLYHLLIAAPRGDDQVSIGAKTLSGFGYFGHVFWDTETFMLPFLTHVHPTIARDLLSYRHHRLPGARRKAEAAGLAGAQLPWESADTGDEVTPRWVPNAEDPAHPIRIWTADLEIHVSAVVAHAVQDYWRTTGDDRFMLDRGAELVLETARFWASRGEWKADVAQYDYSDVVGPDEYHEHVDNNAFTNQFAAWHLRFAAEVCEWLAATDPEIASRLDASPAAAARFREVAAGIHLPATDETGLIEQFSGYFGLEDLDLASFAGRTRSMQAILGTEGVGHTQIIKQPDVLMLAYLLPDLLSPAALAANYAFYNARTDHAFGSSLGPAIHALLAVRVGEVDEGYTHFLQAARADLRDVRRNTADGIHGASAGGLWQALVFGFAGVGLQGDQLVTKARLPHHWTRVAFKLVHRGRVVKIDLRPGTRDAASERHPRGLIFDLDGVITDTAELHYRAWQRLADDEGLPFDRQANEALRGIGRRESLRILLGGHQVSDAKANELMDRKNAYYRESLQHITPRDLLPGSTEFLAEARERGLALAVASASKNAREVLDRLGITDWFDAICDGYTTPLAKPAPDLFLAAASALNLRPDECIVFEDAADGVAAAHAAGMRAVGIGPVERVGAAEVVLAGLAKADLATILETRRGLAAGALDGR